MARDFGRLVERISRRQSELDREVVAVRILSKRGVGRAVVSLPGCEDGSVVATEPTPIACGESAQAIVNRVSGAVTILPGPAASPGRAVSLTQRVRGAEVATARLTISPTIVNDDGGSLVAADLAIYLDGDPVAVGVEVLVSTGAHALTYDLPAGYTASDWAAGVATDGTFTAALGSAISATITFDDVAAALTVVDMVACDAFSSSGGAFGSSDCQHKVTAGEAPATKTCHRWEAYLDGSVSGGDSIRATIISPAGVHFGGGGGSSASVDLSFSLLPDPWPSTGAICTGTAGTGKGLVAGQAGDEFLCIPTGATQGLKVRVRFENLTSPTTSPEVETLTIAGTGIPDCAA